MRRLSHALGLGALLLAAPLAAERSEAAPVPAYHLTGEAGHGALQLVCAGGDGHENDPCREYRRNWAPHTYGGEPYFGSAGASRNIVATNVEFSGFRRIGQIVRHDGYYWVPALDPCGQRVVLVVDAYYGHILGFAGDW